MALTSLPTLRIPPYGVDTFTDIERGLTFTTLHFKHFGGDREAVLAWIGDVLVELVGAGIPASGRVRHHPDAGRGSQHEDANEVALSHQSAGGTKSAGGAEGMTLGGCTRCATPAQFRWSPAKLAHLCQCKLQSKTSAGGQLPRS